MPEPVRDTFTEMSKTETTSLRSKGRDSNEGNEVKCVPGEAGTRQALSLQDPAGHPAQL